MQSIPSWLPQLDPVSGMTYYYLNGKATTRGEEAESTILLGGGAAIYLNATKGMRSTTTRVAGPRMRPATPRPSASPTTRAA